MDSRQEPLISGGKNGAVIRPQKADEKENQPVTLQPSWEANNYPEDELNFKSLTMDEASLALNEPKDKYHLVYFTFLLHGIGVLLPWNMFINANQYFEYKLHYNYTGINNSYSDSYLQYVGFAAQVPNVGFQWINIFMQIGGDVTTRIVWSIGVQIILFLVTIVLAMLNSSRWPDIFFWLTMICVVLLNTCTGIYQNTIYGMAAKLPFKYTASIILGNNICGTFIAVMYIVATSVVDSHRLRATYYFILALFILLLCFDSYFSLPLNRYYRHHQLKEKKLEQVKKQSHPGTTRPPYLEIAKTAFPQLYSVFFVFFCTLAVFPAIQANVSSTKENSIFSKEMFPQVTCFLTFNITAMIGSLGPKYFMWPKPNRLWIVVTLRVLYLPFFLFCNYRIDGKRSLPVFFGDEIYWIMAITLGLTSGYFSSIAMIYTSSTAKPEYASTAGMLGSACLVTGIFAGVLATFIWPMIVV